ncbi:efflux RND transporter periplasmic adaptor subunit [Pararhizobium haloflavum]|uniref:efflux RND transporter periplasmic adaptor subunit n=1 Tax=Pararhizobium haloflavum TaxID=2037914 RepID=UPI000C17ACE7|nr:efflux RND transporter periplasmic adaptor subunit [Pararhizobium haloflavum]
MAFRIRGSHIAAMVFAGAVIGWMATGDVMIGGQADSAEATPPPAERQASEDAIFKVRYATLQPEERVDALTLRGRTAADTIVSVRAETTGTVRERLVDKGDAVKAGDLVCRLDQGTRESALAQAEAALTQAQFDFDANEQLQQRGFASSTQLNALRAARDSAKAELDAARQELERTQIKATTDGIVQDPIVEVGDNLATGDVCVTLIDTDPMLFIGQVSERRVGALTTGDSATVTLVSGETRDGTIRYVARSADPQTRTFMIEIAIENSDGKLRDGITASARIPLESAPAYRVKSSWLTLADDGTIGLRAIGKDDEVEFVPVEIQAQTSEGVWLTGLEPGMRVITVGQDYVESGQTVQPVRADSEAGEAAEAASYEARS